MNIILIGYRCTGKSSVGKLLALGLSRDFLDTDILIANDAGYPIETIIEKNGWDRFRDLERKIVEDTTKVDNLVIATGGGVVMDDMMVRCW